MDNSIKILPLLKYEVHYRAFSDGREGLVVDTFTADDVNPAPGLTCFYRTGNTIRMYFAPLEKIIITPVTSEEIPT